MESSRITTGWIDTYLLTFPRPCKESGNLTGLKSRILHIFESKNRLGSRRSLKTRFKGDGFSFEGTGTASDLDRMLGIRPRNNLGKRRIPLRVSRTIENWAGAGIFAVLLNHKEFHLFCVISLILRVKIKVGSSI